MKEAQEPLSGHQRRQFWGLQSHRKPLCLGNNGPFLPAFRFSARFGWPGWGTQLSQQFVEPAAHLLQGSWTVFAFPRVQDWLYQRGRQHQLVVSHSYHLAPESKGLRSAQTRLLPQQSLFVKTIAMFLPKSQRVGLGNLYQIFLGV